MKDRHSVRKLQQFQIGLLNNRSCAQEEREEQVKDTIDKLREKHGTRYSPMQLRIWSEMIQGGIDSSLTDCPTSSMFVQAVGETGAGRKKDDSIAGFGEIVKEAAVAISSAFSSRPFLQPSSGNPLGSSPAKLIDLRSKCYKQLSDINNLKLSGPSLRKSIVLRRRQFYQS